MLAAMTSNVTITTPAGLALPLVTAAKLATASPAA
jgi:hypothetical protein